jgi:putative (di)nucleoside polyphosphate hydrolase
MTDDRRPRTPPRNIADLPYRPCVGLMLLNDRGQVFVAQRIDQRGSAWQMPQGGIDKGEDPQSAAFRELKEEIGTDNAEILAESAHWHNYDLPPYLVPRVWGGKYRGQTQRWFALHFLGADSDIDLEAHHPEFHTWRWADIEELPRLIVPFKRDVYSKVIDEFRPVVAHLQNRPGVSGGES